MAKVTSGPGPLQVEWQQRGRAARQRLCQPLLTGRAQGTLLSRAKRRALAEANISGCAESGLRHISAVPSSSNAEIIYEHL